MFKIEMKKIIYLLLGVFVVSSFKATEKPVKILIAGDSTAQSYKEERDGLIRGWGQMLPLYIDSQTTVVNHAIGAEAPKLHRRRTMGTTAQ